MKSVRWAAKKRNAEQQEPTELGRRSQSVSPSFFTTKRHHEHRHRDLFAVVDNAD